MKFTSAEALEWEQVRALVRRFVSTAAGTRELEQVSPSADQPRLERALAEAGEAIRYLRAAGAPQATGQGAAVRISFGGLPDVSEAVQKLRIEGAVLEPREIFELIAFLDRASDARSFLAAAAERFPLLGERAWQIGDFRALLRDVEGRIDPNGAVRDNASPHLNRLRREIERQKKGIQDSLEKFLRANRDDGILQEEYITIRNDRFVVPVISGQRRRLPGVIHGASSTGQTLFLEPLDTIDLNNELVRLQEEESREVLRILRELTARLRTQAEPVRETAEAMAQLDLIFAKGQFAIEFDCVVPTFSGADERVLDVVNARHPLLMDVLKRSRRSVIPFDLKLDQDCRTLLISGPNTGGKTVTLKTVGVIALMAQAGLPVPCSSAVLPVFEQVLADIGDNQSIEQNLSTFSAHVARLREMALDVTPDSLVLLDEIGSATDPEEGGALGVALVDHFRAAGAFTVASTHLTALKIYGANTKTVLNASMGFDEETLEPTYRLQTGLPGKSAGLDIAARLGMPEDIMRRARASLTTQEVELSQLIVNLHGRIDAANAERAAFERERLELAAKERRGALEAERREAARLREMEERFEELERKWQSRADDALARIAEASEKRKSADVAQRQTMKVTREMREDWQTSMKPAGDTTASLKVAITEGVRVRLKGIRDLARVRRLLSGDRLEVEAGFLKMQVSRSDVEEVFAAETVPPGTPTGSSRLPKNVRYQAGPELSPSVQELNLIGQRADEAAENVERFLDAAVMATAARVRIIHGHGMGVLKKAVQEVLRINPHVAKYYPAGPYEGGAGATIAELRD